MTSPDTFDGIIRVTPDVTVSSASLGQALHHAVRAALYSSRGRTQEHRIEAICASVTVEFGKSLPWLLRDAMAAPTTQAAAVQNLVLPLLRAAEDAINEDHDNPTTPDSYRPGLRRASHTVRNIRRAVEEGPDQ